MVSDHLSFCRLEVQKLEVKLKDMKVGMCCEFLVQLGNSLKYVAWKHRSLL